VRKQLNYKDRLSSVIPGGAHTYSRGNDQFPSNAPEILTGGSGAYVHSIDGRTYLDYGMGLRSVTLGHAYPEVNAAVIESLSLGNSMTRPTLIELEAAETLVGLVPCMDMVKFAKNGSNATTAAVKLARSYTGKKYVCVPGEQPFFSFDDWFIGATAMNRGVPDEVRLSTLVFNFGNIASLEALFDAYPNQIACVIMEPSTTITPCSGDMCLEFNTSYDSKACTNCSRGSGNFLRLASNLCKKNNALMILDETITGFRWSIEGAHTFFGVEPDLVTYGKGMANGFSLAAVGGKKEIMEMGAINKVGAERTFLLSTTHGAEMCSLAAFIATVKIYKRDDVCDYLWKYGLNLKKNIENIISRKKLSEYIHITGPGILLNYVTKDIKGDNSNKFRTLLAQELMNHGVMMPWMTWSYSHGQAELEKTEHAFEHACEVYSKALMDGVEKYLVGEEVKPVFRKFN
jgi:glutamate-1-semialdehyde 2,1-aminomutase